MSKKYDFGGYATRIDLKCSDGRVIRKDAFKHMDGATVPLVWQHMHNDPRNILGNALLQHREDGTYALCTFNDTDAGKNAKQLVEHKDITSLSIHANQLKQKGSDVLHGMIREVSLVLSGANPGAFIDNLSFQHGDGSTDIDDSEAIIAFFQDISLSVEHADAGKTVGEIFDSMTEEQKNVVYAMIGMAAEGESKTMSQSDVTATKSSGGKTIGEIFDSMNEDQRQVVYLMLAEVEDSVKHSDDEDELEDETDDEEDDKADEEVDSQNKNIDHSNKGGTKMKKNVFDKTEDSKAKTGGTLTHDQFKSVMVEAKKCGSLKDAFLQHAVTYGIENIDYLFPDAKTVNQTPTFIKRDMSWVQDVINATTHTPFSRIKSLAADVTADEARAKGYVKGSLKTEEIISLLKRVTIPTTVYKKQKLDRDDIVDITDMDVVMWLKAEMRMMLDEELARTILIGDGRSAESPDKINEINIRPIYKDDATYAHRVTIDADSDAQDIIEAVIRARVNYKGSGNPVFYTSPTILTDMLLMKDGMGRRLYNSEAELAMSLRVAKVVEVTPMEGLYRMTSDQVPVHLDCMGIMVNLKDYVMGADKGGSINMFDDFDIDYNQYKYLIETRCSGALVQPKAAVIIERVNAG
jgi:HK97 family phage major capsid protein